MEKVTQHPALLNSDLQWAEGQFLKHIFEITVTFVFSHEKQNKIICSLRWQRGTKHCSERNASSLCPAEWQVTCKQEPRSRCAACACIKMTGVQKTTSRTAHNTHRDPGAIHSIFVLQLHLLRKWGLQPLPFFLISQECHEVQMT